MSKNNRSKNNDKSKSKQPNNFFKVDQRRAMKAKKNKSFVKYRNEMNHQAVLELNKSLDTIRNRQNSFEKISKEQSEPQKFCNPLNDGQTNNDRHDGSISSNLNDAINKLSNL